MTGHKPNIFWYLCWKYFAPMVMLGVFVFYIISFKPVKLGEYSYPTWAEVLGLCFSFASMIWVPGYALYYVLTQPGTIMQVGTAALALVPIAHCPLSYRFVSHFCIKRDV
jgi:solute carrier family 6 GABA transporter-like protein 1